MFVTNHVLAGALAGTACRRRPLVAFTVGFASHVVMDLVPHWGGLPLESEGFLRCARRDGILGLAATAAAVAAGVPPRRALAAGVAGAAVLDADKPFLHFFGLDPFPRWLSRFHTEIQRESPDGMPNELVAGALLAAVCALVLARARRARASRQIIRTRGAGPLLARALPMIH